MKAFVANAWNWLDVILIVVSLAALGQARPPARHGRGLARSSPVRTCA